jgi:hypothetical protein
MTVAFRASRHQVQRLTGETVEAVWWSEAPTTFTAIKSAGHWLHREVVIRPLSAHYGIKGGATAHWMIAGGEFLLVLIPKAGGPAVEIPAHALEPLEVS